MKPNLLFIALLLLANAVLMAQKPFSGKKIDRYFDENEREISKKEFKKHDGWQAGFSKFEFETDSCTLHIIDRNPARGKIGPATMTEIRALLSLQTQAPIDTSKVLVIQFSPGLDPCSDYEFKPLVKANYKAFNKKIARLEGVSSFYFHKKGADMSRDEKYANWLPDETQILRRTFFWYDYPCGSYVVIAPNGDFYVQKGEYEIHGIFEAINLVAGKPLFVENPDRFLDEKGHEISQKQFDYYPDISTELLKMDLETDSFNLHVILKQRASGTLDAKTLAEIRQALEKEVGSPVDHSTTMAILYCPLLDYFRWADAEGTKGWDNLPAEMEKRLAKNRKVSYFSIYKFGEDLGTIPPTGHWFPDSEHVLERTFFQVDSPCYSFVAIRPDGSYDLQKWHFSVDRFVNSALDLLEK